MVALNLLPLGTIGAVEANGVVSFGLWLPWVSAADGNAVAVKIIHEDDQFLQDVPPREFVLTHSVRGPYGDFWSGTLPIAGTAPAVPGSAWGTPGRYVYRYSIRNPNVGTLDWIIDPFAREFGVGKLSAFTLGYQPYVWSAGDASACFLNQSQLLIIGAHSRTPNTSQQLHPLCFSYILNMLRQYPHRRHVPYRQAYGKE